MTIKQQYRSMPNLTAAALTTGDDTTAILQAPTIQPVSTGPIAFCPTSIELENYAGQRIRELPTAEVENRSPSILSGYLAGLHLSGIQKTTEPLAFAYCPTPIKLTNYAGPQMRYHIALVLRLRLTATFVSGAHWFLFRRGPILYLDPGKGPLSLPINTPLTTEPSTAAEVENGSPSVSSDRQVTAAEPHRDGSGESDAKSQDLGGRLKRLWYSMSNIALRYTDNVLYDTEIKCTAPMQVSCGSSTRSSMTVTEATVTQDKLKRCSLWNRAKKFARRVFCCAAR